MESLHTFKIKPKNCYLPLLKFDMALVRRNDKYTHVKLSGTG